jgi:hypothetical protein
MVVGTGYAYIFFQDFAREKKGNKRKICVMKRKKEEAKEKSEQVK